MLDYIENVYNKVADGYFLLISTLKMFFKEDVCKNSIHDL